MDVILKNLLHSESIAFDGIIPSNKVLQVASYKLQVASYKLQVSGIGLRVLSNDLFSKNKKNMGFCIDLRVEINDIEFKF